MGADEADNLPVTLRGLPTVASGLVDHFEAVRPVVDFRESQENIASGALGFVKLSGMDEIDGGVRCGREFVLVFAGGERGGDLVGNGWPQRGGGGARVLCHLVLLETAVLIQSQAPRRDRRGAGGAVPGRPRRDAPSADTTALRLAFTRSDSRTQRRNDGTVVIEGRRFEVPSRYRQIARIELRYADWNLAMVHLVDKHSGKVLCRLYPRTRPRMQVACDARSEGASREPVATPAEGMAPTHIWLKSSMARPPSCRDDWLGRSDQPSKTSMRRATTSAQTYGHTPRRVRTELTKLGFNGWSADGPFTRDINGHGMVLCMFHSVACSQRISAASTQILSSCWIISMASRIIRRLVHAAIMVALAGCTVGPDFVPPKQQLPADSYSGEPVTDDLSLQPPAPGWWAVFGDPILIDLERRVAAENLDVQTATIRLAESRFQRGVVAAAQFPSVNGDAQYQRELDSVNGPFLSPNGPFGSLGNGLDRLLQASGQPPIPRSPMPFNEYYVGFDASWELDLWGRVRRQVEAAGAQVDQAADQRRDTLVSSLAELARDYVELRGAQMQIQIAVENSKVAQDVLMRAQERAAKGLSPGLDVENAAAQLENVRAQIPALENQESQYINAVSLLLNQPPGALHAVLARPKRVPLAPPRLPIGVPSELARRRPDIRAAEAQLHAATADIGVAIAAFYPTVQINGTVGFDSIDFKQLWQSNSLQYAAGPSVKVPIFAGGRLKNMLELTKSQQQEAAVRYQKAVMRAWHEVVNALVAYRLEQQRRARLKLEIEHSRHVLTAASERYSDGVGDFLTVLDAERTLLQAEQQHVTSTTNVSLNVVQLFKALGGGWEPAFPN